jgi:outer membrane lipoprotein-sorting protein
MTMFVLFALALAATETPEQMLKALDENITFGTRIADAEMIVQRAGGQKDVKQLKMWARGEVDTYAEFTAPARDKGVKYLKLADNLYMFMPSTEKVVKISGHLLRQNLMDSDFSYEDMLESKKFLNNYDAKLVGEEKKGEEDCWVLELTAKREDVAYQKRKLWLAKRTHLPMLEHRFAKSGALLKEYATEKPIAHGKRFYPGVMIMRDKLKEGTETRLVMTNITFDAEIPDRVFSRRSLMGRD